MEIENFLSINKLKHPCLELNKTPEEQLDQHNSQTYGAFLFDVGSRSVIKNHQKSSTNVKTSSLGVSFHNSKSFVPMQFSSREYEMRAQRMMGSLADPAPPDEMTYEQPSKGDQISNMFEKFAPKYNERKEDEEMKKHFDMDQFKVKNQVLNKQKSGTSKNTSDKENLDSQANVRSLRITSHNASSYYKSGETEMYQTSNHPEPDGVRNRKGTRGRNRKPIKKEVSLQDSKDEEKTHIMVTPK